MIKFVDIRRKSYLNIMIFANLKKKNEKKAFETKSQLNTTKKLSSFTSFSTFVCFAGFFSSYSFIFTWYKNNLYH